MSSAINFTYAGIRNKNNVLEKEVNHVLHKGKISGYG